jgi:hypothetical protein
MLARGVLAVGLGIWLCGVAKAQTESCSKADFQAVVNGAAGTLRDLNQKNRPAFQAKLRELKVKRGWSDDEFLKEAAPLVKDDKTDALDDASSQLLARITELGQQENSEAKTADCALLGELNGYMQKLVAAQTEKWQYMFDKLAIELAK